MSNEFKPTAIAGQLKHLNELQLAELIGVSVKTLRRWRLLGRGPQFVKMGGTLVRYPIEKVQTFIDAQPIGGGRAA